LPEGFQRIRYCGFLSNCHREEKLKLCRQLLGISPLVAPIAHRDQLGDGNYAALYEKLTGSSWQQRPACRQGRMIAVEVLAPARPAFIDTS